MSNITCYEPFGELARFDTSQRKAVPFASSNTFIETAANGVLDNPNQVHIDIVVQ